MGVNIIFNGNMYHFNDAASLDDLLEQTADNIQNTKMDNAVLYDDELF